MNLRKQHMTGFAIAALFLATGNLIHAQEQKPFSPALEQLRETVSERLQTVADQLGLTPEQRTKIERPTPRLRTNSRPCGLSAVSCSSRSLKPSEMFSRPISATR